MLFPVHPIRAVREAAVHTHPAAADLTHPVAAVVAQAVRQVAAEEGSTDFFISLKFILLKK